MADPGWSSGWLFCDTAGADGAFGVRVPCLCACVSGEVRGHARVLGTHALDSSFPKDGLQLDPTEAARWAVGGVPSTLSLLLCLN